VQRNHYDAVVVGGGPAGAIAAYRLARQSLKVALLEKEQLPRYKACGGAVALHANKLLDFPIDSVVERQISRMLVTVNLKSPFTSEAPRPIANMVMRDKFDSLLLEVAAQAGVTVHQRSPLVGLVTCPTGYTVRTPGREFDTRYLIGADGANSMTRKLIGAPRFKRLAVALEWEIGSSAERARRWADTVAVDFGSLRSGYGWIFPKSAGFSVGVVAPKSLARQLRPYCQKMLRHYSDAIGSAEPYIKAGHHLPMRVPGEQLVFGRTLLVGDAAGLIDPVVGEGIYYALHSGQLAAETIAEAVRLGDARLTDYQRKIDRIIQPELQVSKSLLRMLDWAPQFWIPRTLKQSSSFWRYFCSIYAGEGSFSDLPKKLKPFGGLLYSSFARDDLKLYANRFD
jgi:geranylgeranyl reductase family protein